MIAALDIGGTHVSSARVDLEAVAIDPSSRCRLPFRPEGTRTELLDAIRTAARTAGSGVERCGVAVPGPFDYENGVCTIQGVGKLEALYGTDLRGELADVLGIEGRAVRFLNDAEAFVLGEWWAGAARGHRRAIGITLGTGLGSAFLEDGQIVDDRSDVPPEGSLHLVPFRGGSIEDLVSRRGILARYGATPEDDLDVADLAVRARDGEGRAHEAFAEVTSSLAEFLAPWVDSFRPTCLVVGGSIARAWDLIGPPLDGGLVDRSELELVARATNLDDAPLLGAALHAQRA